MSLYFFSKDVKGESECEDGCLAAWPIFYNADIRLDEGLETTDFDVITREDGTKQNTYKGWPLYNFGGDDSRGDNFGVGFPFAGVWPILNSDTEIAPDSETGTEVDRVFAVSNSGATAYIFGFTDIQNPELELIRGLTYQFNVNSPGHPFFIKSENRH